MNDQPFVDLPKPPASTTQPTSDADIRGYDHEDIDDEYAKATAYAQHLTDMANGHERIVNMLRAPVEPYLSLERKTKPLTEAAPPHVDMP
jgi:hypothetical protein